MLNSPTSVRDQAHPNIVNSSCSPIGFYGASTCPMLIASTCPNHTPRDIQQGRQLLHNVFLQKSV